MLAIFKKEFHAYFNSMIGYLFMFFFILIMAAFFYFGNVGSGNPNFSMTLSSMILIAIILIPVITMRLFSEEARQKTDQLLLRLLFL